MDSACHRIIREESAADSTRVTHQEIYDFPALEESSENQGVEHEEKSLYRYIRRQKGSVMELEASFVCAYCLQVNTISVDPTEGTVQDLIEDCQICCRANHLHVTIDEELESVDVSADVP